VCERQTDGACVCACMHACMSLNTSGCYAVWGESFPIVSNDRTVSHSVSSSPRRP